MALTRELWKREFSHAHAMLYNAQLYAPHRARLACALIAYDGDSRGFKFSSSAAADSINALPIRVTQSENAPEAPKIID